MLLDRGADGAWLLAGDLNGVGIGDGDHLPEKPTQLKSNAGLLLLSITDEILSLRACCILPRSKKPQDDDRQNEAHTPEQAAIGGPDRDPSKF